MSEPLQFKPLIRYFNDLEDLGEYFKKSSVNKKKLIEEFNFMSNIPFELKAFYPEVCNLEINDSHCSYEIKKIPSLDASHLILNNQLEECEKVLDKLFSYLKDSPRLKCSYSEFQKNVFENIFQKNLARVRDIKNLAEYEDLNKLAKNCGYKNLQEYCLEINHELNLIFGNVNSHSLIYSHGDLCFSNVIIHDEQLYLIDPRGFSGHLNNTFRAICYDLAKISQCVLGKYDIINHEMFDMVNGELKFNVEYHPTSDIEIAFKRIVTHFDLDMRTVRLVEASLFLSLIPYHRESHKKMIGFLANSIAIFKSNK